MNPTESGNTDDGKNGRSIPTNDTDAPPAAAPSSSNNLPFVILETNGLPAQRGVKRTRYNNADDNEHTSVDSVQENKQRTRDEQPELPDNINTVLPQDVLPTVFRFLETPDFPAAALVCKAWASVIKEGLDGVIVVVDSNNKTLEFSTKQNRWKELDSDIIREDSPYSSEMVRSGRYIYAIIPQPSRGECATIRYDPYAAEWVDLDCPAGNRLGFGLAAARQQLFLVGGKYSFGQAEVLDTSMSQPAWRKISRVLHKDGRRNATALDGCIFTAGGVERIPIFDENDSDDEANPDHSAERYNSASHSWEEIAPMNIGRWSAGLCTVDGAVYAVGGLSKCGIRAAPFIPETTIEKYWPKTNSWEIVTTTPTPRTRFSLAVVKNSIYILGGTVQSLSEEGYLRGRPATMVDIFDGKAKTWSTGQVVPLSTDGHPRHMKDGCATFARFV